MNRRTMQFWIWLLLSVLYVQLNTMQAKKNSEEIIVINNTGGGGCGSGAKTIVKTDGGKKKNKGGHKIILMAGGGGKCGEKHHHHTKVVHVPVPVPVPVKIHEKHHDHWGSASNAHEDTWPAASSTNEVKPNHLFKNAKVNSASVPLNRAFNLHNHMMNRMENAKVANAEQKSNSLLQTLLNNSKNSTEKPNRPDKKNAGTKSIDSATASKKKTGSTSKSDKEKDSGNSQTATSPHLVTHHQLLEPNMNTDTLLPAAVFGLMPPENMQSAMINPAFLPPMPIATITPNEIYQQHLHNQAIAVSAAAQQQSQTQQQESQMQQQHQYRMQQQQSTLERQQQQQQQQMHEAIIQQQLQQLHLQHMQNMQNKHQKMQEAIASSVPQQLSHDSPLTSQLPIPLPGQVISAPVFEPITNTNQTDKTANVNNKMNSMMPQFNELEIIPYEVQQQLQAAAHLQQFGTHVHEPQATLKKPASNHDSSSINYERERFKEHFKNGKHQPFEHMVKVFNADHPLEMSGTNTEAIAIQLPPNQSYLPDMPNNENFLPAGSPNDRSNELAANLLFNAPIQSFMMVNNKPDAQRQHNFDPMQKFQQQTIQMPVLIVEEATEKPTIKRYRI